VTLRITKKENIIDDDQILLFKEEVYQIIGAAINVHKELG
jgi:hypothetical protein